MIDTKTLPPSPEGFGPILWKELHTYAKYNKYDKVWLDNFSDIIPCGSCKNSFKQIEYPKHDKDFFLWTVEVHNIVNNKLSKGTLNISEAFNLY